MKKEIELILNSTHDAMIAVNKEQEITLYNKAAERLTGKNAIDVLGKNVKEVIENTRLPIILATGVSELNKRQQLGDIEIITNRIPLIDESGFVLGAVAVFRDISDMVDLAEELTNLTEIRMMLESVFNSTQDAISVVNQFGKHIMINAAYRRITGLTDDDVLGKDFNVDLVEGDSVHKKVLETRLPVDGVVLKSGRLKRDVVVSAAPIIVDDELRGSVAVIHDISELNRLSNELAKAKQIIRNLEAKYTFEDIKGSNPTLMDSINKAKVAASTPATVILRGESGTGKELFAHAIHNESNRRNAQFVRVNCAAISESILESELFGYDEGAFTGASKGGKIGLFERASGGTIFLDEISEINLNTQAKLLRVLQEKEIVRVGGTKSLPIDVRVISATNINLENAVEKGVFREDLYYRLNVIPITIPSLRERRDDIEELIENLIIRFNQEYGRNVSGISQSALKLIYQYDWPGNIRELENYIGRAIINMKITETMIEKNHLPMLSELNKNERNQINIPETEQIKDTALKLKEFLEEQERKYIELVLKSNDYSRTETAKVLGISIRSLYYKLEKLGME